MSVEDERSYERFRRRRYLFICCALIQNTFCSGIIYGWAAIVVILTRQGIYANECAGGVDLVCAARASRFINIFSVGSFGLVGSAPFWGFLLDKTGPKLVCCCGLLSQLLGSVLFALSSEQLDAFLPAFLLIASGGMAAHLSVLHLSSLFPSKRALVITTFNGAFCFSGYIFPVYKLIGLDYEQLFFAHSIICFLLFVVGMIVWPRKSIVVPAGTATTRQRARRAATSSAARSFQHRALKHNNNYHHQPHHHHHFHHHHQEEEEEEKSADEFRLAVTLSSPSSRRFKAPMWSARRPSNALTSALFYQAMNYSTTDKLNDSNHQVLNDGNHHQVEEVGETIGVAASALATAATVVETSSLYGARLGRALRSPEFILICFCCSFNILRLQFFVGTLADQTTLLGDDSGEFVDVANALLPLGFLVTPLAGWMMGLKGRGMWVTSFVVNTMGSLLYLLAAVPNLYVQILSDLVWASFRQLLFAFLYASIAHIFGWRHFGTLSGIVLFTGALATLMQMALRILFAPFMNPVNGIGSFLYPALIMAALGLFLYTTPFYLSRKVY